MGYKLAGFDVVGCCEIDPRMMEVYCRNNHPKYHFLNDIRDFLKMDDLPEELYNLDVLDGSPPCSVFSTAGEREDGWGKEKVFREGQAKQRLDDLFFWFIKVAEKLRPKVVIAENVSGLIKGNAKGYVNEIFKAFDEAGYKTQLFLLNAAFMGVPQKRERCFFVAQRKDMGFAPLRLDFKEEPITFGEIRSPEGKKFSKEDCETEQLLKLRRKSDTKMSDIYKRVKGRLSGFACVIHHDDHPAATNTAGGSSYRYYDGLICTDQDYINMQTFPQDYDFAGQTVKYITGMSVPPVMMANLAKEVYDQWLK